MPPGWHIAEAEDVPAVSNDAVDSIDAIDSINATDVIEAAEAVEMRRENAKCQISEWKSLCGAD